MRIRAICVLASLTAAAACAEELDYEPLEFTVSGDRLVAIGEIDGDSLDRFEEALDDAPELRTLELRWIGGSVDDEANVEFARVVREMGFTTLVPSGGLVASGGTDLFLAGTERRAEPGACIGVHSWAAGDYTATDLPRSSEEHDRYLDYYDDMEIDRAFYWFTIEAAPAEGMHWMSAEEVRRFGLATEAAGELSSGAECDGR